MPTDDKRIVVLVHEWSVRSTETYGEPADRLEVEARRARAAVDDRRCDGSVSEEFSPITVLPFLCP